MMTYAFRVHLAKRLSSLHYRHCLSTLRHGDALARADARRALDKYYPGWERWAHIENRQFWIVVTGEESIWGEHHDSRQVAGHTPNVAPR